MGQLLIRGGKHANRKIEFVEGQGVRPSGSRVRDILKNWLRPHIVGLRCLDLFSGSGILAFEAMSQGAESVLCVDSQLACCRMILQEASRINEPNITTLCKRFPCEIGTKFDLIFMDPPFDQLELMHTSLQTVKSILVPQGFLYIESGVQVNLISGFEQHKAKKVGQVWMYLWRRIENDE